jgi:DNA-binding response OmpR family regulator
MFNILVAEDDVHTRQWMQAVLKKNGFEPFPAKDGNEALEVMDRQHIDLAVIDLMMPNMDGYELTKQIRSSWATFPVIMVTAKQEPADKRRGFLAGTDDYMTKPVDEQEMILRIKALLRRAKIANERRIEFGNVTLDYDALSVTSGEETIALPQKEFYLLFRLLSYPDTILTRLQLMDEIWGMEADTDDHTLNVHINRLRDKFCDCPDFEIITVRGLGYKARQRT